MVASIQYDEEIIGAILTYFGNINDIQYNNGDIQDMYISGHIANHDFSLKAI